LLRSGGGGEATEFKFLSGDDGWDVDGDEGDEISEGRGKGASSDNGKLPASVPSISMIVSGYSELPSDCLGAVVATAVGILSEGGSTEVLHRGQSSETRNHSSRQST